jgi:hypothetical protein
MGMPAGPFGLLASDATTVEPSIADDARVLAPEHEAVIG